MNLKSRSGRRGILRRSWRGRCRPSGATAPGRLVPSHGRGPREYRPAGSVPAFPTWGALVATAAGGNACPAVRRFDHPPSLLTDRARPDAHRRQGLRVGPAAHGDPGRPTLMTAIAGSGRRGWRGCPTALTRSPSLVEVTFGDAIQTATRTVTLADIGLFAEFTGATFYAHTDREAAAANPLFGGIVAPATWLVARCRPVREPNPGPVLANFGVDNLRFLTPVKAGDTIGACSRSSRSRREQPPTTARCAGTPSSPTRTTSRSRQMTCSPRWPRNCHSVHDRAGRIPLG